MGGKNKKKENIFQAHFNTLFSTFAAAFAPFCENVKSL